MSYPTPMDVAESEDREAHLSPSERLANICSALEESLNESPFTREEWERLDAERIDLLAANEALASELAECAEKRERYALQVCLLLDAMREAGVHITENWCWCAPTVTNHGDSERKNAAT